MFSQQFTQIQSALGTYFMRHLVWHQKRLTILIPEIEGLLDEHTPKPEYSFQLSRMFNSVGNQGEYKWLLTHALKLWRERRDDRRVAQMSRLLLCDANRLMTLYEEGVQQAKEALEIYQRLGDRAEQVQRLSCCTVTVNLTPIRKLLLVQ